MEFIFDSLQYLGDVLGVVLDFFKNIVAFIVEVFVYVKIWLMTLYFEMKIELVGIAYQVAQNIMGEYEVYTLLNSAFNKLAPDLRHAAFELGIVDAIRIVIDALATAFVLRIMGW